MSPELSAKPICFILLREHEEAMFNALSDAQKGYFLHWYRSNPRQNKTWEWMIARAKANRP